MQQLVNNQSGELVNVSHDELQPALFSGNFNLPLDQPVGLKSPDGQLVDVDPQEAHMLLTQGGYTVPSEQEITDYSNAQTYGPGVANHAKAFALGMAEGVPFVGGALAKTLASPEEIEAQKKLHPVSHFLGEATSTGLGLFVGGPEAKGVEAALEAVNAAKASGNAFELAEAMKQLNTARTAFTGLDALNPANAIAKAGKAAMTAGLEDSTFLKAAKEGTDIFDQIGVGRKALGSAVEGSLFATGQLANEYTLGDPQLNAQQVAAQVGLAGLLGAGFGVSLEGVSKGSSALKSKLFGNVEQAATKEALSEAVQAGFEKDSLQGISDQLKQQLVGVEEGLPAKKALQDALKIAPIPIHPIQIEALTDQGSFDYYRALKDHPAAEIGKQIRDVEWGEKQLAQQWMREAVDGISEKTASKNMIEAGEKAIQTFDSQYRAEKAATKETFNLLDKASTDKLSHPGKMLDAMEQALPGVTDYLEFNGVDGAVKLNPYKSTMPFSRNVYKGIKSIVTAVNEEGVTLGGLRNMRENLRTLLPLEASSLERAQMGSLRKGLMDFMESEVQNSVPELELREGFKRYAINEGKREAMEQVFGGSLDPQNIRKTIKPEMVLDRIFSNSVTVNAAKEILGEENFNGILKDYLRQNMNAVTDDARIGFSSNKFGSFLKRDEAPLLTAFGEGNPTHQKIQALNTIMRILPDMPPGNPSGSAKTLLQRLKDIPMVLRSVLSPVELAKHGLQKFEDFTQNSVARGTLNNVSKGMALAEAREAAEQKTLKYTVLTNIEKAANKTNQTIQRSVGRILEGVNAMAPAIAGLAATRQTETKADLKKDFDKRTQKIQAMAGSPEAMMSSLERATENVAQVAPDTAAGIQQTMVRGVQFLNSKIPRAKASFPLSAAYEPGEAEIQKFNRYYEAVENPLVVLKEMESNSLTKESLEAVTAVHPQLYDAMRKEMFDQLTDRKERVPYQKRLMLGMFMRQGMDESTTPQSIMANQMVFMNEKQGNGQTEASKVKSNLQALDPLANRTATETQKTANRKSLGE